MYNLIHLQFIFMDIESRKRLELTNCLCASMRQSTRNISQIYNKHLKASGEKINANQVSILVTISQVNDGSINKISNLLKMERTTLTRNLNILKKSGWVKSNTGLDGRFNYINLTDKGNKVLSKVFPYWSKAQEQVKKILGEELDSFRKNLTKINQI